MEGLCDDDGPLILNSAFLILSFNSKFKMRNSKWKACATTTGL